MAKDQSSPIIYASRGKKLTLWVKNAEGKDVPLEFQSNGVVGIYTCRDPFISKQIQEHELFERDVFLVNSNQKLVGSASKVVAGARNSLLKMPPAETDPEVIKIAEESKEAQKQEQKAGTRAKGD